MKRRSFWCVLAILGWTTSAWCHLNSLSYSTIEIKENEIRWELRFTLLCTLELFSVDLNNDNFLSKEELEAAWPMMYYYLNNKIKVMEGGRQLKLTLRDISFKVEADDSYTVFQLSYAIPQKKSDQILLLCNVQEETDPYHRDLAEITLNDDTYLFVFNNINYFDTAHIPPHVQKVNKTIPSASETITKPE